jgi:hypothetical protein
MSTVAAVPEDRSALSEPSANISGRWIARWTLGQFALWLPLYAGMQVLLPEQAKNLAGDSGKVAALGWATALAAVVTVIVPTWTLSMIAAPVVNHLGGYPALYLLVLVTAVIAALTVQPISSVR